MAKEQLVSFNKPRRISWPSADSDCIADNQAVAEGIPAVLVVVADPAEDILAEEEVLVLQEVRPDEEGLCLRLAQSALGESPRAGCSGKCCSRHLCIHVLCEVE